MNDSAIREFFKNRKGTAFALLRGRLYQMHNSYDTKIVYRISNDFSVRPVCRHNITCDNIFEIINNNPVVPIKYFTGLGDLMEFITKYVWMAGVNPEVQLIVTKKEIIMHHQYWRSSYTQFVADHRSQNDIKKHVYSDDTKCKSSYYRPIDQGLIFYNSINQRIDTKYYRTYFSERSLPIVDEPYIEIDTTCTIMDRYKDSYLNDIAMKIFNAIGRFNAPKINRDAYIDACIIVFD